MLDLKNHSKALDPSPTPTPAVLLGFLAEKQKSPTGQRLALDPPMADLRSVVVLQAKQCACCMKISGVAE